MALFKDEDDYSYEEEQGAPEYHPVWRILGYTVKYAFWALIIFMNGLILWRMFASGDPAAMKTVLGSDSLAAAYAADMADGELDDKFAIRQIGHENMTLDDPDEDKGIKGNYGYFGYTDSVVFPAAHQAQVVFRYNDSTLEHLMEDYGLAEKPQKSGDWYVVRLRVVMKDNSTKVIEASDSKRAAKALYTYYRFAYEGLPDIGDVAEINIDIYYKDDIDPTNPYGTLCFYSEKSESRSYDLDKKDIRAISGNDK